jgi:hypothetical protein
MPILVCEQVENFVFTTTLPLYHSRWRYRPVWRDFGFQREEQVPNHPKKLPRARSIAVSLRSSLLLLLLLLKVLHHRRNRGRVLLTVLGPLIRRRCRR